MQRRHVTLEPDGAVRFGYRDGLTIGGALDGLGEAGDGGPATQGAVEEAVLDLLEREASPAIERVAAA